MQKLIAAAATLKLYGIAHIDLLCEMLSGEYFIDAAHRENKIGIRVHISNADIYV